MVEFLFLVLLVGILDILIDVCDSKYWKIHMVIPFLFLCFIVSKPKNKIIELPKALEDTVGDIPIIEHWDDGKVEIMENIMYDYISQGVSTVKTDLDFYKGNTFEKVVEGQTISAEQINRIHEKIYKSNMDVGSGYSNSFMPGNTVISGGWVYR